MKKFISFFIAILFFTTFGYSQVSQTDFEALVALYNATKGEYWNSTNWNINGSADDVTSDWHGITVEGGRVTEIDLNYNGLSGELPKEIGNLTALTVLHLHGNRISSIPQEIYNLTSLWVLNIGRNRLTTIPSGIERLKNLKLLVINGNNITNLPIGLFSLDKLEKLFLQENQITEINPAIKNLISLQELWIGAYLYGNPITSIPKEIGNLTDLKKLVISFGNISEIPEEISKLTSLTSLYLHNNQLTSLPDLSGLTKLEELYLNNNKLSFKDLDDLNTVWSSLSFKVFSPQQWIQVNRTNDQGKISFSFTLEGTNNYYQWYKNGIEIVGENSSSIVLDDSESGVYHCKITDNRYPGLFLQTTYEGVSLTNGVIAQDYHSLIDFYNATEGDNWINRKNWKSDSVVSSWHGVSVENYRVSKINLTENNLVGEIPASFGGLTYLKKLFLSNNQINYIPAEIGQLLELERLYIRHNNLSSLPGELSNLKKLEYFFISHNNLSTVCDLSGLYRLDGLTIDNNELDFGDLETIGIDDWDFSSLMVYSPQAKVKLNASKANNQFSLKLDVDGTNNTYQWYKSGEKINGETKDSISIEGNSLNTVYCKITNPDFPKLELVSESFYLDKEVTEGDYNALIALYDSTNGKSWMNNTNWLSDNPVENWYGIETNNGKIVSVNLENNNLSGVVPIELTKMDSLSNLIIHNNKLVELPNLSSLKNLQNISISNNKFTFEDIEPNIGAAKIDFEYSPQDTIGESKLVYSYTSNELDLPIETGGKHNVYKWFKNNIEIPDSDNDTLTIKNVSSNVGLYTCKITNTIATELTLVSYPIQVLVITGFHNIESELTNIFPNPSTGYFNVNLSEQPGKNARLILIDMSGKTIYQQKLTDIENRILIEGNYNGTYLLRIIDGEKISESYILFMAE
jgi:Leucine-rich repeat (LRR) protein